MAAGLCISSIAKGAEAQTDQPFRAGAAAVNIDPAQPTSIIAGGFLEGQASQVHDSLYVRAFVLDDGSTRIAMAVVDTCMMEQSLIDQAKLQASVKTGIAVDHMMVSATHTHSAPAAMGCLGTRQDKAYAKTLPDKIASAIELANANLQPARIGWSSIDDWEHTHNRRWIRKPESKVVDPFGEATGLAHMHPGYLSPDVIGPSGPVDPGLSIVSLQTLDGKPLAVIANYSQHYFGAAAISADYFGRFSQYVAAILNQPGEGHEDFICVMTQATSGDLMWMDYGSPQQAISMDRYAESVARYAQQALERIEYKDHAEIKFVETKLKLHYRVPDETRLAWAQPIAANIQDDLPKSLPEVYAREALILHERQNTEVKLQAILIGDLTIATLPNEVYALTGLKLKEQSPAELHFNVELANGAEGYIPTPEQHTLGGYTTWPARTAGLEVQAEPKIVEALLEGLEHATQKPRRARTDQHGPFAEAVLQLEPLGYWRLNDIEGTAAKNAITGAPDATLSPGFAWYLPGPGTGSGIGDQQQLTPSAFSGPRQLNRAVHLAGGCLNLPTQLSAEAKSIALWFWLGEKSGASQRQGSLIQLADGLQLVATQSPSHQFQLSLGDITTNESWPADEWHMVAVDFSSPRIRVYIDGSSTPALELDRATLPPAPRDTKSIVIGENLQGKVDEVVVFPTSLGADQMARLWQASEIPAQRAKENARREEQRRAYEARIRPPKFPEDYAQAITAQKPIVAWNLQSAPIDVQPAGQVSFDPRTYATFRNGRIAIPNRTVPDSYSVSVWFRCETPNDAQPVTAYFFSRGEPGNNLAPGDHLGIGGTFHPDYVGKLLFFNGNEADQVVVGSHTLLPETWNHFVLVRDQGRVRAYLNGQREPEFDGVARSTAGDSAQLFLGARSDNFAPLAGNLAHFALFDRALSADEAVALHAASGQPIGTPDVAQREPPKPTSEPLSPKESLSRIHVPEGYRVELVASEPQVLDPVAFDWDADGRLWVVEMADYPLGMDGAGKPGGRVRLLTDRDQDGRYETSQLFADNLNFPTGILTWRDGVIVTAAPKILFLRDTNGDASCDQTEVLFEGFNEGNQQLRVNGLRWGLDGWVYCANGGHHAGHGVGTKITSTRNNTTYEIGSRDFRFRPDTGQLELESGPSQYGRNRDAFGHWFGVQNANPLWQYVIPDRYLGRNPHVPAPQPIRHIVGPGSPIVFPASSLEKRYHSFEQSGRFTSACSAMIYNDDYLFGASDRSHAFTCEPFHNLVQHNILSDAGISYSASRSESETVHDFFASEDRWCRPVMVRTGPDGALWIADMYRYMIEHPEWLPNEGKSELLPHYRLGDDRGRIYRVVSVSAVPTKIPSFSTLSLMSLADSIDSPNDWCRDKAQQMLLWQFEKLGASEQRQLQTALETVARDSKFPAARVQAAWTLRILKLLTPSFLQTTLSDSHPRVRETGVRLAEGFNETDLIATAVNLVNDSDAKVRLQLALSLGAWTTPEAGQALAELAKRDYSDPLMVAAIMSSAARHQVPFTQSILQASDSALSSLRDPILRMAIGSGNEACIEALLRDANAQRSEADEIQSNDRLVQLTLALDRIGVTLDELMRKVESPKLKYEVKLSLDRLAQASEWMRDEHRTSRSRIAAAVLAARSASARDDAVTFLASQLSPKLEIETQQFMLRAMAQSQSDQVPRAILASWSNLTPDLQTLAIDVLLTRIPWTESLITSLESQKLNLSSIQLTQRASMQSHPNRDLADRARSIFQAEQKMSAKEIVAKFANATTINGDAMIGQKIYSQSCAKCHRRGSDGLDVGPNLASVMSHSPVKLLTNILDPNVDIQPGYQAYVCLLESGEVISGLLSSETANSITITQVNGTTRAIARDEIEDLRNQGVSLMPEGLGDNMSEQDMADLIAFLKQPLAEGK